MEEHQLLFVNIFKTTFSLNQIFGSESSMLPAGSILITGILYKIPRHLNSQLGIKSHPLFSCPAINALAARLFALEVGTREAVVICLLKRVLKTVAHFSDSLLAVVLYSRYG